jgi:thioredoxin reductase (NADPH)
LIVRGSSLEKSMSAYLVERIRSSDNIDVLLNTQVVRAEGSDRLEALTLSTPDGETQLPVDALFVLIGGVPLTGGVSGWLRADPQGFLMTGRDLLDPDERSWWTLERDPYLLESSQPGIFIAGDVRSGSIKPVASAVGDGAMAVQLIHRYLANPDPIGSAAPQDILESAGQQSDDPRV